MFEILGSSKKITFVLMLNAWRAFHVFGCTLLAYHFRSQWVHVCLRWVNVVIEHTMNSTWFQISTSWTRQFPEHTWKVQICFLKKIRTAQSPEKCRIFFGKCPKVYFIVENVVISPPNAKKMVISRKKNWHNTREWIFIKKISRRSGIFQIFAGNRHLFKVRRNFDKI